MIFQPLGDQGILLRFGDTIRDDLFETIRRFGRALEREPIPGVVEWVPGYVTVAVYYRPQDIAYETLREALAARMEAGAAESLPPPRVIEIPTCYGGDYGPDLRQVADRHGLSESDVVALHCRPAYRVHLIGFAPGFPYLGGLPDELITPRRATPRLTVPAGSVALGGAQTGIYPLAMPGGWHLLGRTPRRLFDPQRQPPALLRAGDIVRFVPITPGEYHA